MLFGGRLLLAYNEILYPYHRWYTIALRQAREVPGDFGDLAAVLVIQPSAVAAKRLFDCMDGYSRTDMEEQSCYGDNG